jgi:hypothetical protein
MAALLTTVSEIRQAGYDQRLLHRPRRRSSTWPPAMVFLPGPHARKALLAENQLGATTHISVIDAEGMAAAMTTSNGEGCGEACRAWVSTLTISSAKTTSTPLASTNGRREPG